jgi:Protein of unknown function (DUF2917)
MNRQATNASSVPSSESSPGTCRGRLHIPQGSAVSLHRRGGTLAIEEGEVWLTREGDPVDHRLVPGQRITLRADERAVIGAWQSGEQVVFCWQPNQGLLALLALAFVPLRSTAMALATVTEHAAAALAGVAQRTRATLEPASIE